MGKAKEWCHISMSDTHSSPMPRSTRMKRGFPLTKGSRDSSGEVASLRRNRRSFVSANFEPRTSFIVKKLFTEQICQLTELATSVDWANLLSLKVVSISQRALVGEWWAVRGSHFVLLVHHSTLTLQRYYIYFCLSDKMQQTAKDFA